MIKLILEIGKEVLLSVFVVAVGFGFFGYIITRPSKADSGAKRG